MIYIITNTYIQIVNSPISSLSRLSGEQGFGHSVVQQMLTSSHR